MRPIGFSTGALAYADFRRALRMIEGKPVRAVELSALRQAELIPLLQAIPSLDLAGFGYISIHAPSQFDPNCESALWEKIATQVPREWAIVVHPDAISDFGLWRQLGASVCIENMDKRKPSGRSARELVEVFTQLPDATFCFDIGHARQFDPTMTESWRSSANSEQSSGRFTSARSIRAANTTACRTRRFSRFRKSPT